MKIKNGYAYLGDCLEIMDSLIEQGIQVDAIITDPPYGTTACKWDQIIPFNKMRERLNKLIKPNGAIVLFGSEPFSSALRMSNIKQYKYDWKWLKNTVSNFLHSNDAPLKNYEDILVFISDNKNDFIKQELQSIAKNYENSFLEKLFFQEGRYNTMASAKTHFRFKFGLHKSRFDIMDIKMFEFLSKHIKFPFTYNDFIQRKITYNPQGVIESNVEKIVGNKPKHIGDRPLQNGKIYIQKYKNYPKVVLEFPIEYGLHPTQKPVALIEYLIKTYTNEGETVLDFTAGSFTTAIACENTNRKRICIEKDEGYYNIGIERVNRDTK